MKYIYHAHAIYQISDNSIQHFEGIISRVVEIDAENYKEVKKAIAAEMDVSPERVVIDSLTLIGSHDNG